MQPDDAVVCLSLAVASIARAMQRQADNRQHLIAQASIPRQLRVSWPKLNVTLLQGLGFLSRYRTIRAGDGQMDEVEYNFGRTFHHLGRSFYYYHIYSK